MFDPGATFERFVVGGANELAATAARRAAESPGRAYTPLLICGASGVGKTHLLHAIGHYAAALQPDLKIHLESADLVAHRVTEGLTRGDVSPLTEAFSGLDLLLIDELERLSGMLRTQEELVEITRRLGQERRQLVLTSVLPPADLPGFSEEFRQALDRGLVVQIGAPDQEVRRRIIEAAARERGIVLAQDVVRSLAGYDFSDVRALRSAVFEIIDSARADDRAVSLSDVLRALSREGRTEVPADEFGSFLDDVSRTLAAVVETAPWRRIIAEAILRWEGEGIRTTHLEEALLADTPPDVDALLAAFARDATRLLQVRAELRHAGVEEEFDDPTLLSRAEATLAAVREAAAAREGARASGRREPLSPASPPSEWTPTPERVVLDWLDLGGRLLEEPR